MDIERFNKKKNNIKNLIETLYKNVSINIAGAVEELEEIAIGNLEFYNYELETNKKLKKELDEIKSLYNSKIGEMVLRQDKLDTLNKGIDETIEEIEFEINNNFVVGGTYNRLNCLLQDLKKLKGSE